MAATDETIREGTIVKFIFNGPLMVVTEVGELGATCIWFDKVDCFHKQNFGHAMLQVAHGYNNVLEEKQK